MAGKQSVSSATLAVGSQRRVVIGWGVVLNRLTLVAVFAGALVMIAPFIFMALTSVKTMEDITASPPAWIPSRLTLDNFRQVWTKAGIPRAMANTAYVTIVITGATILSSSLVGFVFSKYEFRGRNALFMLSMAGMMIPFYAIVISLYLMIIELGWVNSYWALVIPSLYSPFGVFMMRQFMFGIPNDLIDCARLDGCSEFRIYWSIILPLAKPAVGALGVLHFMSYWNWFLWPLIVLQTPKKYTINLTLATYLGQYWTDYGPIAAGAFLGVLPIMVVFLAMQRFFITGIATTGMKG